MEVISFNFIDYLQCLGNKSDKMLPKNCIHQSFIDRKRYHTMNQDYLSYLTKNGGSLEETLKAIRTRTCDEYYQKVYSSQIRSLDYSAYSFPAYKFIMTEVLADDWLAIVDFHKKFCRDHALHQPLVAYITAKLLGFGNPADSFVFGSKSLLDQCVDNIMKAKKCRYLREYASKVCAITRLADDDKNDDKEKNIKRFIWMNLFYETAILVAMFHDIGYPWQYINRLSESLHAADFVNHTFADNAHHIWQQFHNRLLMYPFYGYMTPQKNEPYGWKDSIVELVRKSMEKTHGFPGALGFLYLNDLIRKYPCDENDAIRSFSIDWAAMAIMMHDMMKVYRGNMANGVPDNQFLKIRLDADPLSWVVSLADFLEEFERPSLRLHKNKEGEPSFAYTYACEGVDLKYEQDMMEITFCYNSDESRKNGLIFKQEENKMYFDPVTGFMDMHSANISKVKLKCTLIQKS